MVGSLHRLRQMSELASVVCGIACVQVWGHGLGLPGKVFGWYKKMTAADKTVRHVA